MRNFSSRSTFSSTFVVDETTQLGDPSFVRIVEAMLITMGSSPEMMTPSEVDVIVNFMGWFERNQGYTIYNALPKGAKDHGDLAVVSPVFCCHNLNEGHSVVVIWTDAKCKVSYLSRANG